MSRRCVLAVVCTALLASPTEAGWWNSVSSAVTGTVEAAKEKVQDTQEQVQDKTSELIEQGENMTGEAFSNGCDSACSWKVDRDIASVNRTMRSQLKSDCQRSAEEADYMHDTILQSCKTMGRFNIDRTLKAQRSVSKTDCMTMCRGAPGDMQGAIERWSKQSKETLTQQVGPGIQQAITQSTSEAGAAAAAAPAGNALEQKYAAIPLLRGSSSGSRSVPVVLPLLLAGASISFVVFRRRRREDVEPAMVPDEALLEDEE